jgi:hypothetical protein
MGLLAMTVFALTLAAPAPAAADAAGCRDPEVLARLPGCTIRECTQRDYDEAELQSGALDASGEFPRKLIEGQTSVLTYVCAAGDEPAALTRKAEGTLRKAGFSLVYAGGMYYNDLPGFTARKGAYWIQVVGEPFDEGPGYTVTAVKALSASAPHPPKRTTPKAGAPPRRTRSGS